MVSAGMLHDHAVVLCSHGRGAGMLHDHAVMPCSHGRRAGMLHDHAVVLVLRRTLEQGRHSAKAAL